MATALHSNTTEHRALRVMLWALPVAVTVELLLFRSIAALESARVSGVLAFLGELSFNFASLLAPIALVVFLLPGVSAGRLLPIFMLGYALFAFVLPLVPGQMALAVTFGMVTAAVLITMILPIAFRHDIPASARTAIVLILITGVCAQGYLVVNGLSGIGVPLSLDSVAWLAIGEAMVVLNGFAVFIAWGWKRALSHRAAAYVAAALALLFTYAIATQGHSVANAMLKVTGLTLYLPLAIYPISLFFFLSTTIACLIDPDSRVTGVGLLLLLLAGSVPSVSYQSVLVVIAVWLLAEEIRPRRAPIAQSTV